MISAWWLLVIVPISSMIGMCLTGLFAMKGHQDDCAECQYKCFNCKYNKEKSK